MSNTEFELTKLNTLNIISGNSLEFAQEGRCCDVFNKITNYHFRSTASFYQYC